VLLLPGAVSGQRSVVGGLLDITGRKAMDLMPGANDVSGLAPGSYFVRYESDLGCGLLKTLVIR
jgi:hypothetical protein